MHSAAGTDRRLVVVYDDFLGTLQFDSMRFGKNEDHSLMELLDKATGSPNLRFILTTREYILEDAKRVHGAFDSRADELLRYTLTLADYTGEHRAQMLFNHLYFSDLPDSRLQKLVEKRVYRQIIAHKHFNPRIVESISKHANSRAMSDEEYVAFVEREFDDPSKLWEHPFRRDISPIARLVLAVLWSLGGRAELSALRSAVARYTNERLSKISLCNLRTRFVNLMAIFLRQTGIPEDTRRPSHGAVSESVRRRIRRGVGDFRVILATTTRGSHSVNTSGEDLVWPGTQGQFAKRGTRIFLDVFEVEGNHL